MVLPLGIAIIGGGGYIIFNIVKGIPAEVSFQQLQYAQHQIQPFMKYMLIALALPVALTYGKKKVQQKKRSSIS